MSHFSSPQKTRFFVFFVQFSHGFCCHPPSTFLLFFLLCVFFFAPPFIPTEEGKIFSAPLLPHLQEIHPPSLPPAPASGQVIHTSVKKNGLSLCVCATRNDVAEGEGEWGELMGHGREKE